MNVNPGTSEPGKGESFLRNPIVMNLFPKKVDKKYIEAMFIVEDVPGVIFNISKVLASFNVNIESGFHTTIEKLGGVWVMFLEMLPSNSHDIIFKGVRALKGVKDVRYVELGRSDYFDRFLFPLSIGDTRLIIFPEEAFRRFRNHLMDSLGTGGETLVFREGLTCGQIISNFIPESLESINEKLEFITNLLRATGWGVVEFSQIHVENPFGEARLRWGIEAHSEHGGRCHFMRGVLTGVLRSVFDNSAINLRETSCVAEGKEYCVFKLV